MKKRILGTFLTVCMILCFAPMTAMAMNATTYLAYDTASGAFVSKTANATSVTADMETFGAENTETWYVVDSDVTINGRIVCYGDVHLILTDGKTLKASSGITVEGNNNFSVYAQSMGENAGNLTATVVSNDLSVFRNYSAAIGATGAGTDGSFKTRGTDSGQITIHGGVVTATVECARTMYGAAIGGSGADITEENATGGNGNVTIYGGVVTATTDSGDDVYGAAIGGGGAYTSRKDATGGNGNVTIVGGLVTATVKSNTGNIYGTAIGGGGAQSYLGIATGGNGNVKICSGVVAANTESTYGATNGAIIGGGGTYSDEGTAIGGTGNAAIYGGVVTATKPGTSYGAAIGNGGDWTRRGYFNGTEDDLSDSVGIVSKDGTNYIVYNDTVLESDWALDAGKTLTIESGRTLTIKAGATLTNNGTIVLIKNGKLNYGEESGYGTLVNNGTLTTSPISGEGSEQRPYLIESLEDLEYLRDGVNGGTDYKGKYFKLKNDIDMSDKYRAGKERWTPIGTDQNPFKGIFDGSRKRIDNLYINDSVGTDIGLFGRIESATVKNLTVSGSVTGAYNVGGIVGCSTASRFEGCQNEAFVSGRHSVGGIAGEVFITTTIQDCRNVGDVRGSDNVGGIVGDMDDTQLSLCFNSGNVEAYSNAGSLAGYARDSEISNCFYNDGAAVGGTSNSTDNGVYLKTTEQFASGEVAYLLQNGRTELIWGQTLGTDPLPVLADETAKRVYKATFKSRDEEYAVSYANAGEKLARPADQASKSSNEFIVGWYTSPNFAANERWDFDIQTVTGDITLYAKWDTAVASVTIDGATTYHKTLDDALTAVKGKSATIKLLADTTVSGKLSFNDEENITLDMNGHTLVGNFSSASASTNCFIFIRDSKLNIAGRGTIQSTNANNVIAMIGSTDDESAENYSLCTVGKDVTIKNNGSNIPCGICISPRNDEAAAYGVKLTVNGTIEAPYGVSVSDTVAKASGKNLPEINICKDARITASGKDDSCALNASGYAVYNIEGTLTGTASAIGIRSGELNISENAKLTATGTYRAPMENGQKTNELVGIALAVSQDGSNTPITVNIEGGTLSATGENGKSLYEVDVVDAENPSKDVSIDISGGEFKNPVQSLNDKLSLSGGMFAKITATDTLSGLLKSGYAYVKNGDIVVPVNGAKTLEGVSVQNGSDFTYNITYETNGGTINGDNAAAYTYGIGATLPTNVVRDGWTFGGWYDNTAFNGIAVTEISATDSGNKTYYAKWVDETTPTGEIQIGPNSWKEFLDNITFGLFFKETQSVKIAASDNSGDEVTIAYLLSDKELSKAELEGKTFTAYTAAFDINPDNAYVVYAKLTDTSGNVTYINTDGVVLDSTAPRISGITNGKIYCAAQTATVDEEYADTVTVNGVAITPDESNQFTLSPAQGTQTIVATDKAGNSTTVTITVNNGHTPETDDGDCTTAIRCSVCGEIATAAKEHDFTGEWKHDDTNHWHACKNDGCKQLDAKIAHSGNDDGNCTTAVICICGYEITSAQNHNWSTWTQDSGKDTHTRTCQSIGCTAKETASCSGGTATCNQKATCKICGEKYGNKNPDNHAETAIWIQTATTHVKQYTCCDAIEIAEASHRWENGICAVCGYGCQHTGGAATCTEQATCQVCGHKYGQLKAHDYSTEWFANEATHWHECAACRAKESEAKHSDADKDHKCDTCSVVISQCSDGDRDHKCDTCGTVLSTCADDDNNHRCDLCGKKLSDHSGGTATCTEQATCEVCGEKYGELDEGNHSDLRHVPATAATTTAEGNIEYWRCSGCGKYFEDASATSEIAKADVATAKLPNGNDGKTPDDGKASSNGKATANGNDGSVTENVNSSTGDNASKQKAETATVLQTGDGSSFALLIALLCAGGSTGICAIAYCWKRKQNK